MKTTYDICDLRPEKVYYKNYELLPFTLNAEVWAVNRFGSITQMTEAIKNPTEAGNETALFEVLLYLMADKSVFKKPEDVIKDGLAISKQALINNAGHAYKSIKRVLDLSSPLIKNPERLKDQLAMQETQGAPSPCYGVYYDRIAKRYGYSIDQFYELTLRQLHILLSVINEESYHELEVQASLQGRELKPRMEVLDITPEQEKEQEQAAQDAYAELQRRYEEGKANGGR